ncbi:F-box protein CPR1-like [Silene latifolia]|uniref:F-box protein CPR1-like n=1 Tax=Silene latifolia TaxID=37657 RepID=UPI003D772811
MIQSPSFISKPLKQQYNNPLHDDCLIAIYEYKASNTFYFEAIQIWFSERYKVITYAKLDDNPPYNHNVCGPCDGLYYLWSEHVLGNDRGLWNPALNEYKALPLIDTEKLNTPYNLALYNWDSCGFGFDPVTQDYKVVLIKFFTFDGDLVLSLPPCVLVYSLRTNSWKYVMDLPKFYNLFNNGSDVIVNTSLYWLASEDQNTDNAEVIIVFDLATNKCRDIQLPEHRTKITIQRNDGCDYECLMVYHGDIAYVTVDDVNNCFDVWALKAGCWAKKLTMGLVVEVQEPLGQWRDGLLVFQGQSGTTLILCNLDTQQTWVLTGLPLDSDRRCGFVCPYQESLVSLHDVTTWIYKQDKCNLLYTS